jgi:hypothetical protein
MLFRGSGDLDRSGVERTVPNSRPTRRGHGNFRNSAPRVAVGELSACNLASIFASWGRCEADFTADGAGCQEKFEVCSENGTKGRKHLITQAEETSYAWKNRFFLFWIWNMLPSYGDESLPTKLLYGSRLSDRFRARQGVQGGSGSSRNAGDSGRDWHRTRQGRQSGDARRAHGGD